MNRSLERRVSVMLNDDLFLLIQQEAQLQDSSISRLIRRTLEDKFGVIRRKSYEDEDEDD